MKYARSLLNLHTSRLRLSRNGLLADGMIVATTYIKLWSDARKHFVVCTCFRLEETDTRLGTVNVK